MRGLCWKVISLWLVLLACSVCILAQAVPAANPDRPPYLNPDLPLDQRVDDLVGRMTLEEKASQVVHIAAAIPRLQVPAYNWWSESLHGVAEGTATIFPEPIGLGASFDAPLIQNLATAIATEARAKHHEQVRHGNFVGVGLDFWAPNLNIFRDPRWGRGQETYGEDPYLTGRMGIAYVTGMQGDDPKYLRVIATPKHYAVHSGPEPLRHAMDVKVSLHDEEDTYLSAFRAAVVEGRAGSVMCVYNSINGDPGCANWFLLEDHLREKWKFQGYVVSDCDAVYDIERGHHYVKTREEAAAVSMTRGTDLDCNEPGNDSTPYLNAVKQGLLKEKDLDISVKRLMRARMLLGMFDPPEMVKYAQIPYSENNSAEHRALALQAARESMVLLKNDGALPLKKGIKRIAVVGPLADQTRVLCGNYHGTNPELTSVLEGIKKQFPGTRVSFAAGTGFLRNAATAVPGEELRTEDGQAGLKGEYYKGVELQGAPLMTRVDKTVDFDFVATAPSDEIGTQNFSVRWSGYMIPKASGLYDLGVTGDDGFRLWLDGRLLVEDWTTHGAETKTEKIKLTGGHKYAVRLEYFQGGGGAVAKLVASRESNARPLNQAVDNAQDADAVVAVVGITSDLEGEEMSIDLEGFKGGDRTSLDLPQEERELLEAMKSTGKPLVVVLMNGSALSVNWTDKHANAILEAWYPGEEGGQAVAETLAGVNNPAGKLPVTFYRGVDQLPEFTDYSMKERTYRYFHGDPLYPFGYGLSYSTFSFGNLKLSSQNLKAGDSLDVDADVKNTSAKDGDEVAELYLGFPEFPGAPIRALRAFRRVHLQAGQEQHLHFTLSPQDLSAVDETGDHVVAAGTYALSLGDGQPGKTTASVDTSFTVEGDQKLPD